MITANEIHKANEIMQARGWHFEWRGDEIMYAIVYTKSSEMIDFFIPTRDGVYRSVISIDSRIEE